MTEFKSPYLFQQMETFVAASKLGSFTETAKYFEYSSVTTVSSQIKKLEEFFQCLLFHRAGPEQLVLTEEGARALIDASRILELVEDIRDGLSSRKIKIGMITTVQNAILPEFWKKVRQSLPRVDLEIVPGSSMDLYKKVLAKEILAAVIIRQQDNMSEIYEWTTIIDEPLAVVVHRQHESDDAIDVLKNLRFIKYNDAATERATIDKYLRAKKIKVKWGLEADEPASMIRLVETNTDCCTIVPSLMPFQGIQAKVKKLPIPISREIGIIQLKRNSEFDIPSKITEFLQQSADEAIKI